MATLRAARAGALLMAGMMGGALAPSGVTAAAPPAMPVAPPAAQPTIPGHFTLETLDGREVTDETYRGRWLLVYFGYTYCPDVCPTVLVRIGQALGALGPLADRIQPVFITVDPRRDTAPHLLKYLAAFSPRIAGLRGNPGQIRDAARQFHVYYRPRSLGNGQYSVDHSSYLYVMAPDGHFARLLADSLSGDQLAGELKQLIGQGPWGRTAPPPPAAASAARALQPGLRLPEHFADSDDAARVADGKLIYARACASCHGRRLQGQPLWQLDDEYRGQRAPAHDQTGHTWVHSDDDLFAMTREGRFPDRAPVAARAVTSRMPAFKGVLTDQQIVSVIAFIKATWPIGLRLSQAMLNAGRAGMPANVAGVEWTFPPNCTASAQRWRTTSR